jgi:tetratricopeptide (TPR) repeat protein
LLLFRTGVKIFILFIFLLFPSYGVASDHVQSQPITRALEYIQSNKPSEALGVLSNYQPSNEELSSYHYTYAKAYELLKHQNDLIVHLRLAYLYSKQDDMKEQILLERAEAYMKIGYYSEATLIFRIFLKNFSSSRYAERVYLGLADSLYRLGLFSEAIESYEKAGDSFKVLYGKANSLHAMGKTNEAHELYMAIVKRDRGYVEASQETLYNIGENLRLLKEYTSARIYLNTITEIPFKYRAYFSIGLMESDEEHIDTAAKFFKSSLNSPERQLRCKALLHLADIFIKKGREEDAKSVLLEIRNKYPYGKEYDDALYMLSQLYKRENNVENAISLIRELVFRQYPDKRALDEFEALILEVESKDDKEFLRLWKSVGHWLMQPSRSQSLLKIAKGLRFSGKPYLEICTWLSQYGSEEEKSEGNLLIADFYADLGDTANVMKYLQKIKSRADNDVTLRIKAKTYLGNADYQKATQTIFNIKDIQQNDLSLLAGILASVKNNQEILKYLEKALNKSGGPSLVYTTLADRYYEMGKKSDSLKYYQTVISLQQKGVGIATDDLRWALYRISVLSPGESSVNALKNIQQGSDTLSRFSMLLLKEASISEKISGMF